jgi:hypothetical protein
MILKCFDTTERATLDLLWLLTRCFSEWSIIKPKTSRSGNAERYFVGKYYLGAMAVSDAIAFLEDLQERKAWIGPLFEPPAAGSVERACWSEWMNKVFEFQECLERQEYETIRKTLDLIHSHDLQKIRSLVRENIQRSMTWCRDYGEALSSVWCSDFERNITRESMDLIQILSPPHSSLVPGRSVQSWYTRPTNTHLSFEGFRRDTVEAVYVEEASTIPAFPRTSIVSSGPELVNP